MHLRGGRRDEIAALDDRPAAEAGYLIGLRDADSLRTRAATAEGQRRRLAARGLANSRIIRSLHGGPRTVDNLGAHAVRPDEQRTLDIDLALAGPSAFDEAGNISAARRMLDRIWGRTASVTTVGVGISADCVEKDLSSSEDDTVIVNDGLISIDGLSESRQFNQSLSFRLVGSTNTSSVRCWMGPPSGPLCSMLDNFG
jgi:hypothetical protein